METCGNCKFSKKYLTPENLKNPVYICRRFPPQWSLAPINTPAGMALQKSCEFPMVPEMEPACGEYLPRGDSR